MAIPDNIRYLIEALRTPAPGANITPQTGIRAGNSIPYNEQNVATSIGGEHHNAYLKYMQTQKENGEDPMPYEEWLSKET